MMTSNTLQLLNEQITHEFSSAYLYLSMAIDCEAKGLKGSANWLRKQFYEEQTHGEKIINFMLDIGANVSLNAIEQPKTTWDSLRSVFENVLQHEKKVTHLIHTIYESAINDRNHPVTNFLNWFISEQVEEEATAQYILDKLSTPGNESIITLLVDQELGCRK